MAAFSPVYRRSVKSNSHVLLMVICTVIALLRYSIQGALRRTGYACSSWWRWLSATVKRK